jgi:hypothetical protein
MKRIRMEWPKPRKERRYEPLPLDPRDPDILRAKQLWTSDDPTTKEEAVLRVGQDAEIHEWRAKNPLAGSHG